MNDQNQNNMLRGFLARLPPGKNIKVAASWTPSKIVKRSEQSAEVVLIDGVEQPQKTTQSVLPFLAAGILFVAVLRA